MKSKLLLISYELRVFEGDSLVTQMVKSLPATWETQIQSLEKEMAPTPVFLPGKSHGQGSLVGYSPQGHKESNMTERLHFQFLYRVFEDVSTQDTQLYLINIKIILFYLKTDPLIFSFLQSMSR